MILVLEPDPDRPGKVALRIVVEEGEPNPETLVEIRMMLERGIKDLPGRISMVPVKRFPDRRK